MYAGKDFFSLFFISPYISIKLTLVTEFPPVDVLVEISAGTFVAGIVTGFAFVVISCCLPRQFVAVVIVTAMFETTQSYELLRTKISLVNCTFAY